MDKRYIYPQNVNQERDLFFLKEDRNYLRKHASGYHPEIAAYIEKAKPLEGLIQVLLTALGATPYWPQNVNGDDFPVSALAHGGDDYGYKTFLSNANYFTHHVNKDPALAKGKVLLSVWNEPAKRVELVIGINPTLDPDAADMVSRGDPLCFSMGAKLPFDVCTICANKAKTRAEYCDHLRYQMNQIDPESGKLIGAINPFPKFFDISRVLIPADKTAYMWEKIASAAPGSNVFSKLGSAALAELPAGRLGDMQYLQKVAEQRSDGLPKKAAVQKKAEIKKRILAVQPQADLEVSKLLPQVKQALEAAAPSIPEHILRQAQSIKSALVTLLSLGMLPTPQEHKTLHSIFTGIPEGSHRYCPTFASALAPYIPHRSYAAPVLVRRIQVLIKNPSVKTAAEAPRKEIKADKEDSAFSQGMKQGILAALAYILAPQGVRDAVNGAVKNHPIPLLLAGVPLYMAGKALTSDKPLVSGQYDLAGPQSSLYNSDWRSRFAAMQARPVTVIKTGEDLSQKEEYGQSVWAGIPGLVGLHSLFDGDLNHAVSVFGSQFPALLDNSILSKSAAEVGEVAKILKTAASLSVDGAVDFDSLPLTDRTASGDLLILGLSKRLLNSKGEA